MSDAPPDLGGPAVETVWKIHKLIAEYDRRGLSDGDLDESELRRFVSRARTNAIFQVMLGTRPPPGAEPNAKPSPAWVTRPSIDELTILWLLAGGWPSVRVWPAKGLTVLALVRATRAAVSAAVKAVGSHPYERETKI